MKRKRIILFAIAAIVLSFCILIIRHIFVQMFFSEPTIIQTYVSPDGENVAYLFESDGGATTGWFYHISILPTGDKLGKGNGNIYISGIQPESILWIDNKTIYVKDYDSVSTTKRKENIRNITIRYNSLEKMD